MHDLICDSRESQVIVTAFILKSKYLLNEVDRKDKK